MDRQELEQKVKGIFEQLIEDYRGKARKFDEEIGCPYQDPFADTRWYTGKRMTTHHCTGEGYEAYLPEIVDNDEENNNCLLVVTYDGAGYDFLSLNADYGEGIITKKFINNLKEQNLDVILDHYCNWAFCVYMD